MNAKWVNSDKCKGGSCRTVKSNYITFMGHNNSQEIENNRNIHQEQIAQTAVN